MPMEQQERKPLGRNHGFDRELEETSVKEKALATSKHLMGNMKSACNAVTKTPTAHLKKGIKKVQNNLLIKKEAGTEEETNTTKTIADKPASNEISFAARNALVTTKN